MRILLVEDDTILANNIKDHLVTAGFAVDVAYDGDDGEYLGDEMLHDAVILDLGLPKRPGLEVLKNWRRRLNPIPVIILTARNQWHERIAGMEAGADDYLGKPFHMEELTARIKALIRRSQSQTQGIIEVNSYRLDEHQQAIFTPAGEKLILSGTEFRLLRCLMINKNKIMSKDALMEHIYDHDTINDHNVIEVYVTRLRKKIGKESIKTFRGQGYMFCTPESL
ncbi:MAG: response regulator transcription factor [Magnetococcales bacterium]|nr:response regulator transcription factor [Magnetococcales bacterium]